MNVVRNVKKNILKGVLIANKLNGRKNKMTDEEIKRSPSTALGYYSDKLTPEQFEYCVYECPSTALKYCVDKLTKEQFDCCVHRDPWTAIRFCADKLTEEQKQYCEEKSK